MLGLETQAKMSMADRLRLHQLLILSNAQLELLECVIYGLRDGGVSSKHLLELEQGLEDINAQHNYGAFVPVCSKLEKVRKEVKQIRIGSGVKGSDQKVTAVRSVCHHLRNQKADLKKYLIKLANTK